MKKTFVSFTRIILIMATLFASCVVINQSVRADAGSGPDPTISGVGPYQPQKTNVQMLSETVIIELPSSSPTPNQGKVQFSVKASFTMQNQSEVEETMQVIFPLTRLDAPWDNGRYDIVSSSFVAKVNGQAMPITEITTPSEMIYSPNIPSEGKFHQDVRWAAFEATFPIHQEVLLEVEYNMRGGGGFTGIDYILETGAGWYGNILSADIILRLPYPVTDEVIKEANAGYVLSGNEVQWKMKNFEPTRKDNIAISVVNSTNWFSITQLRSKVEQNSNDADGWYELGNQYTNLAIQFLAGGCEYSPAYNLISTHFADLAAQAYEKTIELRPNWGDAHLQLANILWFGNENVNKLFDWLNYNHQSNEVQVQPIKLDDPYVQRVLKEIDLALSYKVTDEYYACRLYSYINKAIPELKLTLSATETVTPKPPTETPVPTSTSTSIAFVMPTQVPTSKTDSSTSAYGFVFAALVVLGIFIYFRVYRVKIQK
jgi:hypothetical protein